MKILIWMLLLVFAVPAYSQERKLSRGFIALQVVEFGSIAFDVESTQHCIDAETCKEGNPIMGQGRAQEYAVAGGFAALSTWLSYRSYKSGGKWWIAPVIQMGMHGAMGGLNLRF